MHADIAHHFIEDGYDVTFLSSAPATATGAVELPDGLTHRVIVPRRDRFRFGRYFSPAHEFRLRAVPALRNLECDTFYSLTYFDAAAWADERIRNSDARFVVHSIGVPNARAYARVPWDARMLARSIKLADRLFVLSRFAADQTLRHYGRLPDVLPPPVRVSDFPAKDKPPDRPRILFSGDVNEPRKGAELLIRAVGRIAGQMDGIDLVFTGAVAREREVRLARLGREVGISPRFLGLGSRDGLPETYRSSSVVVLPSQWEAFGLALVEALASGTPIVAATLGGGADILNRAELGALFDASSDDPVDMLARALQDALEKSGDPSTIAACNDRALDFDWSRLGKRYREAVQ